MDNKMKEANFSKAFVFLKTETDKDKEILEEIRLIPSVQEVFRIYGAYDIILKLEEQDITQLKSTITNKIRMIDGVESSLTLMIM